MKRDKKDPNQLVEDANRGVEYLDDYDAFMTAQAQESRNEDSQGQNGQMQNGSQESSPGQEMTESVDEIPPTQEAQPDATDGPESVEQDDTEKRDVELLPENPVNNPDLNQVLHDAQGLVTSTPRDLEIGAEFDEKEEYIAALLPEEVVVEQPEGCVPPPGTIDFMTFYSAIGEGEGDSSLEDFFEDHGGLDDFNISISVENIDELGLTNFFITAVNLLATDEEIDFSGEFTIFLGENTFNFEDIQVGYNSFFDNDYDMDIFLVDGVSLNILGCGCDETIIDANRESRIFDIWAGDVTIEGVELTGGRAGEGEGYFPEGTPYTGPYGGAIYNRGDLTLIDSCVVDNCADFGGGGIYSENDPWHPFEYDNGDTFDGDEDTNSLTLINSVVLDNKSMYDGGGIRSYMTDVEILEGSRVDNNYAGVYLGENCELTYGESGELELGEGSGGGIYAYMGSILVSDSQVNNNLAASSGGGIDANTTIVTIENSQVVGNHAVYGDGGGLNVYYDTYYDVYGDNSSNGEVMNILTVDNSNVDWNRADDNGGGIYFYLYDDYNFPAIAEVELQPLNGVNNDMDDYHLRIINDSTVNFNRTFSMGEGEGDDEYYYYDYDDGHGAGLYQRGGDGLIDNSTFDGNIITNAAVMGDEDKHMYLDLIHESPLPLPITHDYIEDLTDDEFDYIGDLIGSGRGAGIYITSPDGSGGSSASLYIFDSTISRNLEFSGGEGEDSGAGIYNDDAYIGAIVDTTISENQSLGNSSGGGLYNNGGIDLIDGVDFLRNYAGGSGGGIYNSEYIYMIEDTTFDGNLSRYGGGGIYNSYMIEYIDLSTFNENESEHSSGGGIRNSYMINTISRTTFSDNEADYRGGGIYNGYEIDNILRSTFYGNQAEDGGGLANNYADIELIQNSTFSGNMASDDGGAIYNLSSSIDDLSFSTIVFNTAEEAGDGVFAGTSGTIYINNSIIAFNTDTPDDDDFSNDNDLETAGSGSIYSDGYNIIGNSGGIKTLSSDKLAIDPLIGPLADNGGPTQTHALLIMSPAIDMADNSSGIDEDQRGFFRPIDGPDNSGTMDDDMTPERDIGAYEYGSSVAVPIVFDLDNDGVELISPSQSQVTVLDTDGQLYQLGWVSGDDALLVYDNNQDGVVNSLAEIELSRYHPDAMTDLQGLSLAFDTNFDSLFNSMDDEFGSFGIWQDSNENGVTEFGEYQTLVEAGITEIDLTAVESTQWVADNIIYAEGLFTSHGAQGTFADVALSKEVILEDNIEGIENVPPTFNEVAVMEVAESFAIAQDALVEHTIQEASTVHDIS